MASAPGGTLDLIAQLMQQMIELQRETIVLQRDGTPNMTQMSKTKEKRTILSLNPTQWTISEYYSLTLGPLGIR